MSENKLQKELDELQQTLSTDQLLKVLNVIDLYRDQNQEQAAQIEEMNSKIEEQTEQLQEKESTIQKQSSEMSDLKSTMLNLSEELTKTQKQNQELVKSNDDLRNSKGLLSRKKQEELEKNLESTMASLSDAKKKIDMSSVEAVEKAKREKNLAIDHARIEIEKANKKRIDECYKADEEVRKAKKNEKKARDEQKFTQRKVYGILLTVISIYAIAGERILPDIGKFFYSFFNWMNDSIETYLMWLYKPYYTHVVGRRETLEYFSTGPAWLLRIFTFVLLVGLYMLLLFAMFKLIGYACKKWGMLSIEFSVLSFALITACADHISMNTMGLYLLMQIGYLGVLKYFDICGESRNVYWNDRYKQIQSGEVSLISAIWQHFFS